MNTTSTYICCSLLILFFSLIQTQVTVGDRFVKYGFTDFSIGKGKPLPPISVLATFFEWYIKCRKGKRTGLPVLNSAKQYFDNFAAAVNRETGYDFIKQQRIDLKNVNLSTPLLSCANPLC